MAHTSTQTNQLLETNNLQASRRDHKNRLTWELTDEGKKFGQYIDTGKKHSDGTSVQQIKWFLDKAKNVLQ